MICLGSLALASPAQANFLVNDSLDLADPMLNGVCEWEPGNPATCSLRAAIQESNNTVASDTITFSVNPATLSSTLPTITQPTVIDGNGSGTTPGDTVIDGTDAFRIFFVNGAAVTFKDLRIQDGGIANPAGGGGAGILTANDTTLTNVVVTSNQLTGTGSGSGAGIYAQPPATSLTLTNSTVSNNTISVTGAGTGAFGGGISALANVELTSSTVSNNSVDGPAGSSGAGVQADLGFQINGSTINGNFTGANGRGGGLGDGVNPAPRTITNSTFSGNAAGSGGGSGVDLLGPTTITSSTFLNFDTVGAGGAGSDVRAGGAGTTVTLKDTILAGFETNNCFESGGASIESAVPGHNLDVGASCGFGATNGNLENTPAMLGGLSSPPVPATHPLLPGSPAIDAASPAGLGTDQRGIPRPQGARCDIGAFELEAANDAPSCAGFPALAPAVIPIPATAPAPKKKCKKKRLKRGKCVKKKRKKKRTRP